MRLIKCMAVIALCLCSFFVSARMYSYDASDKIFPSGDVNTDAGWNHALSAYVNPLVRNWVLFDVLRIEGNKGNRAFRTWKGTLAGWQTSTEAEKTAALASGPIIILRQLGSSAGGGGGDCLLPVPDCTVESDPLMIDLGQDGIHLGAADRGIFYDFTGTNIYRPVQWVKQGGNDAFLVVDKNSNGMVDNGAELLGRGFLVAGQGRAANGFEDLAQYDQWALGGNDDGFISAEDSIWSQLLLWLDSNADGVSTPDEMMPLVAWGITELELSAKENGRKDSAGNLLRFWSWAKGSTIGHSKFKMVDVYFRPLGVPIVL